MERENLEDDEGPGPRKRPRVDPGAEWSQNYSEKAMEMMKKMGYQGDKGLGKQNQGRLEPVIAKKTDGRRGFGSEQTEESAQVTEWENTEILTIPEEVTWLENNDMPVYSLDEMKEWIVSGPPKMALEGETLFCDPDILTDILESKSVFDTMDDNDLRRARSRSNPYETIRSSIFLNRAAVKMANIESMCDSMFTNPRDKNQASLVGPNELLYFADICAGPGGFSEYVLYRKAWQAKGFGLTLKGANDFKLDKFFAGSPESFDPYYGVKDDGDIFDQSNQDSFEEYIRKHCNIGVHFVMADGGFSVEGQQNIQEILSKQLYLCQCLTALKILRTNGSFVCKLFDLFTPFSVGLMYVMYMSFEQIAIIKPNSSRPANSERYLVCKWKKSDTRAAREYLNYINYLLNSRSDHNDDDILEIVDMELLTNSVDFFNYITQSNNTIGKNQVVGLRKIAAFHQNPKFKETRQSETRTRCLELWDLPDKLRQAPEVKSTDKLLDELLGNWSEDYTFLSKAPQELLRVDVMNKTVESIFDWYFVPIGRGETNINMCSVFLCRSKGNLLRYNGNRRWEPVEQYIFDLSPKTLFYGEIVYENIGEGRTQSRVCALHIIDAIVLGGINVRQLKFTDRIRMCEKYALSLNKPYKDNKKRTPIRCKPFFKLRDFNVFFQHMRNYNLKDNVTRLGYRLETEQKFFVPGGILLFNDLTLRFFSKMSNSQNRLYYYDKETNISHYMNAMPQEIADCLPASFRNSFQRRLIWKWTNINQVAEQSTKDVPDILYRDDFNNFILEKLTR